MGRQPSRDVPAFFTAPRGRLPASLDRRRNLVKELAITHRCRSSKRSPPVSCPDGTAWLMERPGLRAAQNRGSAPASCPDGIAWLTERARPRAAQNRGSAPVSSPNGIAWLMERPGLRAAQNRVSAPASCPDGIAWLTERARPRAAQNRVSAPVSCPNGIAWLMERPGLRAAQNRVSLLVAATPPEAATLIHRALASRPERRAVFVLTFRSSTCMARFPIRFMTLSGSALSGSISDYSCNSMSRETPSYLTARPRGPPRLAAATTIPVTAAFFRGVVTIRYTPDTVVTPAYCPGTLCTSPCVRHQSSIVLTPPTRRIITRNTKINKVWITDSAATSVNELPTHKSNT